MKPNLSHLYETTPLWLVSFFVGITLTTVWLLYTAVQSVSKQQANRLLALIVIWLTILGLLAYRHVFQHLNSQPPAFLVVVGLPMLTIIGTLLSARGRRFVDQLPLAQLTYLHTIRVPVELALYGLYLYQQIPQLMTFEGHNLDVLSGLTAPLLGYLVFQKKVLRFRGLLIWNVLALGLLVNIVSHALLSAPMPFEQLAFDQPNVAILKAPYVWLPGFIVPTVLFAHLVAIRQLLRQING